MSLLANAFVQIQARGYSAVQSALANVSNSMRRLGDTGAEMSRRMQAAMGAMAGGVRGTTRSLGTIMSELAAQFGFWGANLGDSLVMGFLRAAPRISAAIRATAAQWTYLLSASGGAAIGLGVMFAPLTTGISLALVGAAAAAVRFHTQIASALNPIASVASRVARTLRGMFGGSGTGGGAGRWMTIWQAMRQVLHRVEINIAQIRQTIHGLSAIVDGVGQAFRGIGQAISAAARGLSFFGRNLAALYPAVQGLLILASGALQAQGPALSSALADIRAGVAVAGLGVRMTLGQLSTSFRQAQAVNTGAAIRTAFGGAFGAMAARARASVMSVTRLMAALRTSAAFTFTSLRVGARITAVAFGFLEAAARNVWGALLLPLSPIIALLGTVKQLVRIALVRVEQSSTSGVSWQAFRARFNAEYISSAITAGRTNLYDRVIYRCVVGSQAYGLAGETSDIDRRGIYLPPADVHWSLFSVPEQLENEPTQEAYWELQKFLVMALKANPNVLACLYSPLVETATPLARELLAMRSAFLSRLVYQTYNGYVASQFKKMQADIRNQGQVKWKHVMHLLRLLLSGIEVLRTGHVPVRVDSHREQLLAIRRGEVRWEETEKWRLDLHRQFDQALGETQLPDRPDYERANAFLIEARRRALAEELP